MEILTLHLTGGNIAAFFGLCFGGYVVYKFANWAWSISN